jgi:hypothetical protein
MAKIDKTKVPGTFFLVFDYERYLEDVDEMEDDELDMNDYVAVHQGKPSPDELSADELLITVTTKTVEQIVQHLRPLD